MYVPSSAKLYVTDKKWVNELANFNLEIHYKPRKDSVDEDFLLLLLKIYKFTDFFSRFPFGVFPENKEQFNQTHTNSEVQAAFSGAANQKRGGEAWLCTTNASGVLEQL